MGQPKRLEKGAGRTNKGAGGWTYVLPEEILAYRKDKGLSRAKLAAALGVSTTSIQNWESGRAAALPTQRRLRALIDGEPLPQPEGEVSVAQSELVGATGKIVAAYVANQSLSRDEVMTLIRDVKRALSE